MRLAWRRPAATPCRRSPSEVSSHPFLEASLKEGLPMVSIVVLLFGLSNFILRIPKDKPEKALQWRLLEGLRFKV